MRFLCIVFMVVLLAGAVFADTAKSTPPDPRLDKKVTIEVTDTMLEDVAKQLTEQTGVTIKAGTGERDWKVRERKVTIHAKDVKLGTLMEDTSKLLGFYVSKSGKEGEWAYTFWQDMKGRMLESEMLSAAREAEAQRAAKLRQSALDTIEDALKLSTEEALAKRNEDPWTAYLGGTKAGRAYCELMSYVGANFPVERDLMLRGLKVSIDLSNLPPGLIQGTKDIITGGLFGAAIQQNAADKESEYQSFLEEVAPNQLQITPMEGFGSERQMGMMGFGGMVTLTGTMPRVEEEIAAAGDFAGGIPLGQFPLADSKSAMGKIFGKMFLAADEGESLDKIFGEDDDMNSIMESFKRESQTEKTPPTDPELLKEIDLKDLPDLSKLIEGGVTDESEFTGKAVAALSKAVGKAIVVESFESEMPCVMFLKPGKQPFYHVLIGLEKAGYQWTLSDDALCTRPDDWALLRSYDIPESLLEKYRGILAKNGELTLDDLAEIVIALTDEQIDNTLMNDKELDSVAMSLASDSGSPRELLRLYGSLSAQQKSAIRSEEGLGFGSLSGPQWDRLNAIINDELGGIYIADGTVSLTQGGPDEIESVFEGAGKTHAFNVSVMVSGEEKSREFSEYISTYSKAEWEKMQKEWTDAAQDAKGEEDASAPSEPETGKQ